MGNKCKRFLMLLLALLMMTSLAVVGFAEEAAPEKNAVCYDHGDVNGDGMITDRDAVYVLYSTFPMFKEQYPIYQDVDLNKDNVTNVADAIYLLYAAFHFPNYDLNGTIHAYFDPVWTWTQTEDGWTASVAFSCGCGEEHAPVTAQVECESASTTCVAAGYEKYTATATYDGQTITDLKTIDLPAGTTGHDIGEPTCTEGAKCANCDYTLPELGHSFQLKSSTPATCNAPAVEYWECSCGEKKTITQEGTLNHTYQYVEDGDVLYSTLNLTLAGAQNTECLWVKRYSCADCGEAKEVVLADTYHKHSYTVTLTKEATCVSGGVKTYTCDNCGDSYTENTDPNPDAHKWNNGVTADGVITYTCIHNAAHTKTAVAMTNDGLDTAALSGNEVKLAQGTTVALDEAAVNALDDEKSIVISVVPANVDGILSQDEKEQIAGNTVYDFTMKYDDGTAVSEFAGSVTVSLPYTLKEGDDIDSIDVWFISDKGELTQMKGTYANGFVTFTTDHFSYYTVTRLTAAERCARYGHIAVTSTQVATCTVDGYTATICHRCGEQLAKEVTPAAGHDYVRTGTPTCNKEVIYTDVCSVCGHTVRGYLPALGHNLVLDETRSNAASCSASGKETYTCSNDGCSYETVKELSQLPHDYNTTETAADCTHNGSVIKTCADCGASEIVEATAALGHDFKAENAVWTWNETKTTAAVTLTCGRDESHVETLTAVIVKTTEAASCSGGTTTYTAKASYNKVTYTDVRTITLESVSHQPGKDWISNETQHYHQCDVCDAQLDTSDHSWNDGNVVKAATCKESGTTIYACQICGYEKTVTVDATGKHDYKNGVCTGCGKAEIDCTHIRRYKSEVDLSAYNICGDSVMEMSVCECGEYGYTYYLNSCNWEERTEERTAADGTKYTAFIYTCKDCGLTREEYLRMQILEDQCAGMFLYHEKFTIDNTTIVELKTWMDDTDEPVIQHPCTIEKEVVDMAQYGMCEGGKLVTMTCPCGEKETYEMRADCRFRPLEKAQTENVTTLACQNCGVVVENRFTYEKFPNSCYVQDSYTRTFTMNGEQIAHFTNQDKYAIHTYEEESHTLIGDTCEDGVHMFLSCLNCDHQLEKYVEYHHQVVTDVIDVSDKNLCFDALVQTTCLCDQKNQYFYLQGDSNCQWVETSYDAATNTSVETCSVCGVSCTIVETLSEKDSNCYARILRVATYKDTAGSVIATGCNSYGEYEHDFKSVVTLLDSEGNCLDGVKIRYECEDCDFVGSSYTEYSHVGMETQRYTLEDACDSDVVLYACACGERNWHDFETEGGSGCAWNWISDKELENGWETTWKCYECGLSRTETTEKLYTINSCSYMRRTTVTLFRDDKAVLNFVYDATVSTHKSVSKLTLLNGITNCEDGRVQIEQTCLTCGFTDSFIRSGSHYAYVLSREVVSTDRFCGDLELITQGCACGYNSYQYIEYIDGWCENKTYRRDEETGEDVATCSECGLEERHRYTTASVEGNPCLVEEKHTYRYVCDGELIVTAVEKHIGEAHDWNTTFSMFGETCDEGVTVTQTCEKCGETGEYTAYGCESHLITRKTYHDGTGICGPIVWHESGCACGNIHNGHMESNCNWTWVGYDEELGDTERCLTCGLTRSGYYRSTKIEGTCKSNVSYHYTYSLNNEVLFTVDREYTRSEHNTVFTFEMNGQTCEDGYRVTMQCVNCDYTEFWGENNRHSGYTTAYYDLSDYGMCDGQIEVLNCPCGEYSDVNWWNNCDFMNTGKTDPDTGLSIYRCAACGTTGYRGDVAQWNPETCHHEGTFYAKFTQNDQVILDVQAPIHYEAHDQYAIDMTLKDPSSGSCTSGFDVILECASCGEIQEISEYHHQTFKTKHVDLAEVGGCEGYFTQWVCACGQYSDCSWNYDCDMTYDYWSDMDDSYITHDYQEQVCEDCGLTILRDSWSEFEGDSCIGMHYAKYQISLKGTDLGTFMDNYETERHDYDVTSIELLPGSVTCEDGIRVTQTCRSCGYSYSYQTSGHEYICDESIELTAYGSVCGGKLNHYVCGCGQMQRYDFDQDTLCEVDEKYVSHWIDGIIDTSQYTSQGYVGSWSNSYSLICAVTDPQQCGLKIRMAEYWLKQGCEVVEYQTWQLGYDDLNGTWEKEITIATGDKHAYHAYTSESINQALDDGGKIAGTLYSCPDCGSTYTYKYYYAADGDEIKYERIAENALYATNGENQRYHFVREYGLEYSGYRYKTLENTEYTHNDGSVFWDKYVWEYDFTNGCYGVRINTESDGYYSENEINAHNSTSEYVNLKDSTCTQHGSYKYVYTCRVCEYTYDGTTYIRNPIAHSWNWNSDLGTYVCYYCDLENINGASGSVVLEDFTEEYGNGTDYVIGYWNRDRVEFLCSVSIILDDVAEDQDNELYLTGIAFESLDDEIVAVSCNIAEVQQAADAALKTAGYTGSYAIRISCVPVNADDPLDYAITFDSQIAE